jgi:hypothetical protein
LSKKVRTEEPSLSIRSVSDPVMDASR